MCDFEKSFSVISFELSRVFNEKRTSKFTNNSLYKRGKSTSLNYSQTCSNHHLYKTTIRLRRPMLSLPKQIPIQSLLYKTTTCLTRPATTLFVSQMKKTCRKQKKNLSKTTITKFYPAKKWEKHKATMHKKMTSLLLYLLYCYFIMQSLFNVYKNRTIFKII